MESPGRMAVTPQMPADGDVSHSVGQTPTNQLEDQSQYSASHDPRQPRLTTEGWELQRPGGHSLQLEFQDSNLSPALSLLPTVSGEEHNFSEYSLFHKSHNEFAPLRAYPDFSMASERFHSLAQDQTTQASDRGSLSQHPLAQATVLYEEGASSCCSLSQHSLSPGHESRQEEIAHSLLIATGNREKDSSGSPAVEAAEDEMFFLRKDVPAKQLLECLQKDVGMISSSSVVSSASGASMNSIASLVEQSRSTNVCKPGHDQSMVKREGPPGEASLPQQQTQHLDKVSNPDQTQTRSPEVCNITMGSRSTQPDDTTEVLHRELLSEAERLSSREAVSKNQQWKTPAPPAQSVTPNPVEMSGVMRTNHGQMWTEPFSAGVIRIHREQDLLSSGNQTGIDGSYLDFLPQSQSTPGVFLKGPLKSSVKAKLGQLSVVESNKDGSYQSNTSIPPSTSVPLPEDHHPDTAIHCLEEATTAKVQSLPSLNYMQKVDAWRANQSLGKTSLFDSLALQGFSGISPKKKAYDAVSHSLNRILSEHVRNLQQPPVSNAANQTVTQGSSTAPSSSSSPARGEAVGSAPNDKDNTRSVTQPSASPFGRSQSHSSLSTVVMLVQKDQQTERHAEKEKSQDDTQQLSATVQPSLLVTLGQFSDVSVDRDVTLSSSQDSYNSGIKLGTSVGTSSVTSLEVDNYAPYWTSKLSTPPPSSRPRELNIEERIPLYLHNLGIDQSPSTILTPFVPRGPVREPEFSPTDLCTIKGSIGTPSKSTQPSEGGSPQKGEFSRSSILSVDSSISIPFSLDSLAPAVPIPEQTRHACSLSDAEVLSERRLVSSPQPSHFSILQPSQQQQKNSQNAVHPGERLCPTARSVERNVVSPLQTSCSMNESAEDSLVSSKALWDIRKLLSQAENVISAGSSAASATPAAVPRLLSDGDVFPSTRKKTTTPQNSLFPSSSAPEDPRTHSSFLGARSSSDSMLISERPRQSSVGRESVSLSWQPGYSSTQALITSPAADMEAQDGTEQSSLVLSKSVRRSEPEGCSAAPPDNKVPTQPPVKKPLPTVSPQQTSTSSDTVEVPEETEKTRFGGSAQSSSSSRILEEMDQGVVSDVSSESSLAVRVAKLLQSESPATMVSSTTSITDQEEGKAREWIKMKISGQQCETLELGKEDRERIEEIKRELLLKNPIKSQGSTDTESSVASSVRVPMRQDPPQPAESFALVSHKKIQVLQGLSTDLLDSSVQPQNPPHPDLEAQVRDIASREGVTLPRTKPQAFTSITIATRRRSTSPSPSTSPAPPLSPAPEPLHLTELSTGAGEHPKANRQLPPTQYKDIKIREPALLLDLSHRFDTRNQNLDFNLLSGNQKRQGTVGGQLEECTLPSRDLDKEDVSVQDRCISDGGGDKSPARTGHISHVHLTLSPKAADHSLTVAAPFSHAADVTGPAQKGFAPLRHCSSAPTSPDEGVGLSSPPEWLDTRVPKSQSGLEKTGTSNQFKTIVTQQRIVSTSAQSFKQQHRPEVSTTSLITQSPVPVLLPYKPHGSEELFYVPQTEADISDTTMESSHTGSDDAVPPRFTSEVLGSQDPGLDRGVNIRHLEGIYSKRLKMTTFRMQQLEHRADKSSQTGLSQTVKPSSQVSVAFTRVPLSNKQEASRRDQGTSPVQFLSNDLLEPSSKVFQPVQIEMDYNKTRCPLNQSSFHEADGQWDHQRRDPHVLEPMSQQRSSSLDQLWQRFCDRWSLEEVRSTNEREMLLRERLERLSHLIHSTKAANVSGQREKEYHDPYSMPQTICKKRQDATREDRRHAIRGDSLHYDTREMERNIRGSRQAGNDRPIHHHAWTQSLQVEERSQSLEDDSHDSYASSLSHSSFQSQHLCPADKDETETLSITSGSKSTIDTARLIRAFGAHRVQHLKTSSSLSKLYSTIIKQKEGREQRRGRNRDPPLIITPSETTGTDESVAADYASSTSTYTLPSHRGPSRSLAIKKGVKLVSKGIQAGDLEIVSHGTRRHTRDVGTTFPSPRETRVQRTILSSSSSSAERGRGEQRSPSKSQGLPKQRNSKRNPSKHYPEAVSWFISVDNLKENKPEELSTRPSTTWFESYSRRQPWREPLRQRQVYEDRNQQPGFTHDAEMDPGFRTKTVSSGLARVSLQEALEMRRPEFISRSRQRVRRLTLQVEERKLLADTREGDKFFHKHGGLGGMPKPAGTALLRRAVPRKEMIQRSKQIYENLPEVQKRREEERRKVEYQSYRLNAQLYNKRITNRVLSRRSVWQ